MTVASKEPSLKKIVKYSPGEIRKRREQKKSNSAKRSLARLIACQVIYQYDFYNGAEQPADLMNALLDNYLLDDEGETPGSYRDRTDVDLVSRLISGVCGALPEIDVEIADFLSTGRQITDLPEMLLPILRCAVFELKYQPEVPIKVVINEYVDLAACFYQGPKVTFVNGILENIAARTRPAEFEKIKK